MILEPFYQNDLITLYNADCLLPEAIDIWSGADVMITDPPYGTNLGLGGKNTKGGYGRRNLHGLSPDSADGFTIVGDDTTETRDTVLELWGDKPTLVFGSPRFPDPPIVAGIADRLVWNKKRPGINGGPWRYQHESIYVSPGWTRTSDAAVSILTAYPTQTDHMHAKPVPLMMALMEGAPPGIIVDPFAGSGSTLVAASTLGRRAIGFEIDPKYCELLSRRLGQGAFDLESLLDDA